MGHIEPRVWEAALELDSNSKPWRVLCSKRNPEIIVGWGSFEKHFTNEENETVNALHVSIELGIPGGFSVGLMSLTHEVINVLFVENVSGRKFRRIGVGKVFDQESIRDFRATYVQDFELE